MKHTILRLLSVTLAAMVLLLSMAACQPTPPADVETNPITGASTEAPTDPPTETEAETETPDLSLKLVKDGASNYVIDFDSDTCKVPAYTLCAMIAQTTGVILSIDQSEYGTPTGYQYAINFRDGDEAELGNYGYAISVTDTHLTIAAATLAGFDMAITRLLTDCTTGQNVTVPAEYAATETLNWDSNYVLDADDFKEAYLNEQFYNDKNDSVAYVLNAMYRMFTLVNDGQGLVYRFGNEPTWFEWMSEKVMWTGDTGYINELKGKLKSFPQVETGYLWSWGSYPYWKVDSCYSIHYDGTFRYISAVYDVLTWENSTDFLYVKDTDSAAGVYTDIDASKGRTVLEKTEAAMNYILEYLHGKDGYIQLTVESTYLTPDGSERFDYVREIGEYCWNNTGKDGSTASNYWDNLCFGNYDAYENALFYQALNSMVGIYRMLGGEYNAKADELEALAVTVRDKYNEMYWSTETGRYIACIDTDGRKVDFGLTFLNFEAMKYGLATPAYADSIFSWIDGTRIVEGEDRMGADILLYEAVMKNVGGRPYRNFRGTGIQLAAVTNTVAINNAENQKLGVAWWHGPDGINVWGSARYGSHLENGGYIFYPVFYELMARTEYIGAQSTTDRLANIAKVYEANRLVTDQTTSGSTNWLEGLIGEFPESGLVPTAYFYGLMGVEATNDGLSVAPKFNNVYEYMGVKKMTYGGYSYGLEVNRNGSLILTCTDGVADMTLRYTPDRYESGTVYSVIYTVTDGTVTTESVTLGDDGVLTLTIEDVAAASVVITPVLG